ncbi:AGAP005475-PA-like protein [Anopheles sinensis]|uniref:AGAP005475-PA-like protein n=1 Tax=Anopheles sinensis TaxID=74873 RepID=A0A084WE89_ANOSI|nr:AGAP005475-PA-like protein [Anopheles sinensis]
MDHQKRSQPSLFRFNAASPSRIPASGDIVRPWEASSTRIPLITASPSHAMAPPPSTAPSPSTTQPLRLPPPVPRFTAASSTVSPASPALTGSASQLLQMPPPVPRFTAASPSPSPASPALTGSASQLLQMPPPVPRFTAASPSPSPALLDYENAPCTSASQGSSYIKRREGVIHNSGTSPLPILDSLERLEADPDPFDFGPPPKRHLSSAAVPNFSPLPHPDPVPSPPLRPAVECSCQGELREEVRILRKAVINLQVALEQTGELMTVHRSATRPSNFVKLETREQLDEFEGRLGRDASFVAEMVAHLKQGIMSLDPKNRIARVIDSLFSRRLFAECSWTGVGRPNPKIPFVQLVNIFGLITRVAGNENPAASDFVEAVLRSRLNSAPKRVNRETGRLAYCKLKTKQQK